MNESSTHLQFTTEAPSSTSDGASFPDNLDLDALRLQAEHVRKHLKNPFWVMPVLAIVCFTTATLWSVLLLLLDAPDELFSDHILGFSIWFGFLELPLLIFGGRKLALIVREQERIDRIFTRRLFPDLPHQHKLLRPDQSTLSIVISFVITYVGLFIIFVLVIPYGIGSLVGQRDIALWFGLGLHAPLFMLTIDFLAGTALLPWIRPEIYSPDTLRSRRIRISFNWLIVFLLAELIIVFILALGGRHPNFGHFFLIVAYNAIMMTFIAKWPIIRIAPLESKKQFDKALVRTRFWKQLRPYIRIFDYIEASYLQKMQQYERAETILLNAIPDCPDQNHVELILGTLSICYSNTERKDQALQAMAALAEIQPHRPTGYAALAEGYSDDIPNPQRALTMMNIAFEQFGLSPKDRLHRTNYKVLLWAIRGWILQQLGQIERSDEALHYAWSVPLDKDKPALAILQFYTAKVMLDRGETSHAIGYLEQAIANDPKSYSGRESAKKLEELRSQT